MPSCFPYTRLLHSFTLNALFTERLDLWGCEHTQHNPTSCRVSFYNWPLKLNSPNKEEEKNKEQQHPLLDFVNSFFLLWWGFFSCILSKLSYTCFQSAELQSPASNKNVQKKGNNNNSDIAGDV
ncbi:hypothetical protein HJG60_009058 [Phyllostomus discolor]|uniref:Uncharacterized protein n=1 Tax=Phyllostomus discolor TaxID=89673 RepID=A0A834DFL8_9CHIR|nr:hypothetical protein HJG60_009058 [Phyllostomus discolor]